MPAAFKVALAPHDPRWAADAEQEAQALARLLGDCLLCIHHIGSTAIPGIRAKPILDLLPTVASLDALDARRSLIEACGYEWWGPYGLPGRRYCTKSDPVTERRLVQLHCYADGSREIQRHLAFRDHLRARPDIALEYERRKLLCRSRHPDDSHAYGDCKAAWIARVEAEALAALGPDTGSP